MKPFSHSPHIMLSNQKLFLLGFPPTSRALSGNLLPWPPPCLAEDFIVETTRAPRRSLQQPRCHLYTNREPSPHPPSISHLSARKVTTFENGNENRKTAGVCGAGDRTNEAASGGSFSRKVNRNKGN
uniref:(northern house mosquito) hypothetical protein n=1 Tax=Culex pipiens TaxID=7175 RepID=A0A8D8A193_CULPI